MSRILITKRRILFAFAYMVIMSVCLYLKIFIILSFFMMVAVLLVANNIVRKKINDPISKLSSLREIKSYNTIVIGDYCEKEVYLPYCGKGNVLEFICPKRSIDASYQILRHTFSVLEENGTCIIVNGNNSERNRYSVFDLPFFHFITLKELKLETLKSKSRWPLLFYPVCSIMILAGMRSRKFRLNKNLQNISEIKEFCEKRNLSLIYLSSNTL